MYQRGGLSHISLSDLELSFALHQVTLFGGQTALFTCPAHLNKDLIYFSEGCIPRCSLCFLYHQLQHCYLCCHGHSYEGLCFSCCLSWRTTINILGGLQDRNKCFFKSREIRTENSQTTVMVQSQVHNISDRLSCVPV